MVLRRVTTAVAVIVGCSGLLVSPPARAAGPPLVDASWVTDVTATGANLRAAINANGLTTQYHFEYITQAAYEANLAAVPSREGFFGASKVPPGAEAGIGTGTTAVKVVQHVGGLVPFTTYRYRPVATNATGPTIGPEHVLGTQTMSPVFHLPDGRGWEIVSPVDKHGGWIGVPEALFGGGDFQAAGGGSAVTYSSATAFGGAAGAPPVSQYVSRRTGSGWATENVSAPLDAGGYGDEPDGAPYRVFSDDLSRGLTLDGSRCAIEGSCPPTYSLWVGGRFQALPTAPKLAFAGASPNLRHIVFDTEGGIDEWSGGPLIRLSTVPDAALAAPLDAISNDGSRIYFEAEGSLYLREGAATVQVDESVGGGGVFQTATPDGTVAFFTVGDSLYRFEVGVAVSGPIATGVAGVLGASSDGSRAYFLDTDGLELWDSGTTTTIAPGADAAQASDYPPASGTARVSADGLHLAFLSKAELSGYDNADSDNGEPDSELYLYGPPSGGGAAALLCVSCNPTGERPQGPTTILGAPANASTSAYKPRVLSADGQRLFFDSGDRLFALDTNAQADVYEWEANGTEGCTRSSGCVSLISSGRNPGGASFVDASADGRDVFFLTNESLVGADPGSIDLYDARVDGGFPELPGPTVCIGDACQSLPGEPEDPTPGTLVPNPGNPRPHYIKEKVKGQRKKHHRRHRKHGASRPGGRR